MLLQVSNPGSMSVFSLSVVLWVTVIVSVIITAFVYFFKRPNKTLLWAHHVIDPLQHGLHKWNHKLNNWWQHNRGMYFFGRTNNLFADKDYPKSVVADDSFASELISSVFLDDEKKKEEEEQDSIKEKNELLLQQNARLKQELHQAKTHNRQLLHAINELRQFREINQQLLVNINSLQAELNDVTGKWMSAGESVSKLRDELKYLSGVEKELIDAVNHARDLEWQTQKIPLLEAEIKSLEAEREWLFIQVQQIKTKQLHEFKNLQVTCNGLAEERNQLQDKIVMLESEVGALSRTLNNNKQKQNEDVLWESKYIITAKELNSMRFQYANTENELAILRNREQVLREKAKLADGLQATLALKNAEIASLQRRLYECQKK